VTFQVGDRVSYHGGPYRKDGSTGTIDREETIFKKGWYVLWDGEKAAYFWSNAEFLQPLVTGPEVYEEWFK